MEKQYKVLWAEDDQDIINLYKEKAQRKGIEIISAIDGNEARKILATENIDGVIADAHYPKDRNNPGGDKNIKGLIIVASLLHEKEEYHHIPMVILSANLKNVKEQIENAFDFSFLDEKDYFYKLKSTEVMNCFDRIKEKIEEYNSPQFIIRNRYRRELAAIKFTYSYEKSGKEIVSNAEKDVLQWLVDDYMGNLGGTHNLLNPLRRIIERLMEYLISKNIIPNITLNNFVKLIETTKDYETDIRSTRTVRWIKQDPKYLKNVPGEYLLTIEGWRHIPPTIGRVFKFLSDITNDASHDYYALKYGVVDYIDKAKTTNIFRVALHSLMEVIRWYGEIIDVYNNSDFNGPLWVSNPRVLWEKTNNWWNQVDPSPEDVNIDEDGNWHIGTVLVKPTDAECTSDINLPIIIGALTVNEDSATKNKYPLFYPISGIIGIVKKDSKGTLCVYDSCIAQTDINDGDKVKILSLNSEYNRNREKRLATVEKITDEQETSVIENETSGENTTNETPPSPPETIVENTTEEKSEKESEVTGSGNLHHPLMNTIVTVEKKDGLLYADDILITDTKSIKDGDKIFIQSIESNAENDNVITKAIKTFENYPKKILTDSEGNWYVGSSLVKSSKIRSIDNPPSGEFLIGKVGVNKGSLKEKYPLIVRGLLIENINVAVFPGYILKVKQRDSVLTASNCLVEGENIKEGDTVVVKDVVSNGDSTTNKMYKAKLIVELYKEESDGNKECKETTE